MLVCDLWSWGVIPKTKTHPWLRALLGSGGQTPDTSRLSCSPWGRHWEPVLGRPGQSSHRSGCSSEGECGEPDLCQALHQVTGEEERRGENGVEVGQMKNPLPMEKIQIRPLCSAVPLVTEPRLTEHACTAARGRSDQEFSWGLEFLFLWLPSVTSNLTSGFPGLPQCCLSFCQPGGQGRGFLWPQRVSVFAGAVDLDSGALLSGCPLPCCPSGGALLSQSRKFSTPTSGGTVFFSLFLSCLQ